MIDLGVLTFLHTAVSLIAIAAGVPAVASLIGPGRFRAWRAPFLALAILTTGSGFLFPFIGPTPAFVVGIVAALVLIAVLVTRTRAPRSRLSRRIHDLGVVISLYLLVFVLVAQGFMKVPALHQLAPTGTEPAFAIAQLVVLGVFAFLGVAVFRGAAGPKRVA